MKKTIIIVVVMLIIGAGIGWYLSRSKVGQNVVLPTDTYLPERVRPKDADGVIEREDFSVLPPEGWRMVAAPAGISLMVMNQDETTDDAALKRINFKSYFAITYEDKGERSNEEFIEYIRSSIAANAPGLTITDDRDQNIGGRPVHITEGAISQQGADFAIGIGLLPGTAPNDAWMVTFNAPQARWDEYYNAFLGVLESFQAK